MQKQNANYDSKKDRRIRKGRNAKQFNFRTYNIQKGKNPLIIWSEGVYIAASVPFRRKESERYFFCDCRPSCSSQSPATSICYLLPWQLKPDSIDQLFLFQSKIKYSSLIQGGTCQLHDLVVMKRLLREWEQFWTASSLRCLIERRRLGTEPKFSQQAWQVTSHLTSPRTTENKADFSTLSNSLQDFTGKEVRVKVSLTSNK